VVVVTDSTVVAVWPPAAFSAVVCLIGFDVVFGFTFRALCTRLRLCWAAVLVFGLAAEDFTPKTLPDVVCERPWPVTFDEVTG
jgi:hypothetical protein